MLTIVKAGLTSLMLGVAMFIKLSIFSIEAFPGFAGNKETCPFILREQGNIGKYFKGTWEQNLLWGIGSMEIFKITFWEQGNKADHF